VMHQSRIRECLIRSFLIESALRNVESGVSVENFFEQGITDAASVFSRLMTRVANAFLPACVIRNPFQGNAKNVDFIWVFAMSDFLRERAQRTIDRHCDRHRRAMRFVRSQTDSVVAYTLR